jgi:soluble lytic murein transglycosylase-like protein
LSHVANSSNRSDDNDESGDDDMLADLIHQRAKSAGKSRKNPSESMQRRTSVDPPSSSSYPAAETEEANDMLYKALMNYKRMEQQHVSSLASDTRTITEAILRKQAEAQVTKLAVSASSQYATNEKYVEVNSGRHPRIKVFKGMHALSPDEVDVYSSLVEGCPSAQVLNLLFAVRLQQSAFM